MLKIGKIRMCEVVYGNLYFHSIFFCKSKTSQKSPLIRKKDACVDTPGICKTLGNGLGTPSGAKVFLFLYSFHRAKDPAGFQKNLADLPPVREPGPTQGGQARGWGN